MTRKKQTLIDYTVTGVAILVTMGVLFGAIKYAHAEERTQFYDVHGRDAGTASTYGDTTTYRDRQGRDTGTATTYGNTTTFRDRNGRTAGSAVTNSDGSRTYYDQAGRRQ